MTTKQATTTKQQQGAAAPAAASGTGLAVAPHDELSELGLEAGDLGDDGLGEVEAGDMRIPALVINFKGVDKNGRAIPADALYNTVDETVSHEVHAALLLLKKTNLFSRYDDAEKRTEIMCRSADRVTGTMADGRKRPCFECPDAEWRTLPDGKRVRNCSSVWNVIGMDRQTQQPFVMRFKRTSLPVIKQHLQRFHIGRRVMAGGKRANYPLYVFGVKLAAKMADGGKAAYALPVIERTEVLSADEIRSYSGALGVLQAQAGAVIQHHEDNVEAREGSGDSTSFEYGANAARGDAYAGAVGQDFVDEPQGDEPKKAG